MSSHAATQHYQCANDCRFEGCPGHDVTVTSINTSDQVSVSLRGIAVVIFDLEEWRAIVAAWDQIK